MITIDEVKKIQYDALAKISKKIDKYMKIIEKGIINNAQNGSSHLDKHIPKIIAVDIKPKLEKAGFKVRLTNNCFLKSDKINIKIEW